MPDIPHNDEDGFHDADECYRCHLDKPPVQNECRCGNCCRELILEASLEDAAREPKITQCDPLYEHPSLTASGQRELIGYLLNSKDNDYACAFLDHATNLCTIYETRPLMCRLFCCDTWKKERDEELLDLGIKEHPQAEKKTPLS